MLPTHVGRLLSSSRQRLSLRFYHKAQTHTRIQPVFSAQTHARIQPVFSAQTHARIQPVFSAQTHARIQPVFSVLSVGKRQQNFLSAKDKNTQFLRLFSVASIKYQNVSQNEAVEAATAVIDSVLNQSVPRASEASEAASSVIESIISSNFNSPIVKAESTETLLPSSGETVTSSGESVASLGESVSSSGESVASSVESVAVSGESLASGEAVSSVPVAPADANELILDFIPEKPVAVDSSTVLGEPSFEALDLASWWPSGRMQYFMENIHVGLGLEWWQTIILTTICVRIVVFPLVVKAQKNVAAMNNIMPEMSKIQTKLSEARKRGDQYESAQLGQQLQTFMKEEGVNPLKNIFPVLFQLPIFMSMFLGLRGMANCPVPSMETGGLLWFQNLTMADPYFLLPILTSTTLYLQLKLGTEGVSMDSMGPIGKTAMKVMPFVLIPLTMNFPAAVTFYWFTTNLVSVVQGKLIRTPAVRKVLGVPEFVRWDQKKLEKAGGAPKKGFRESVRDSIDNWKVQADVVDRRAYDEKMFQDAATAPVRKTYKYDPTKPIKFDPTKPINIRKK